MTNPEADAASHPSEDHEAFGSDEDYGFQLLKQAFKEFTITRDEAGNVVVAKQPDNEAAESGITPPL